MQMRRIHLEAVVFKLSGKRLRNLSWF